MTDDAPDTVRQGPRPMRDCVRAAFFEFTRRFEGLVPWLYLDIKGLVTVGLGQLCDPHIPAGLDFRDLNGLPASHDEVLSEWQRIKGLQSLKEFGGGAFRPHAALRVTEASIRAVVEVQLDAFWRTLVSYFPDAHEWPADAQLGLVSIAWACGPAFPPMWPKFSAAAHACDWVTAADECEIDAAGNPGVVPRNRANRALFTCAAHTTTPEQLSST